MNESESNSLSAIGSERTENPKSASASNLRCAHTIRLLQLDESSGAGHGRYKLKNGRLAICKIDLGGLVNGMLPALVRDWRAGKVVLPQALAVQQASRHGRSLGLVALLEGGLVA